MTLTVTDATHPPATLIRRRLVLVDPQSSVSASFSASLTNGCVPLIVQFRDTSTGNPTTWAWDLDGDGLTDSNERNPSRVYTTPDQIIPVSLRVTNATCNGDSSTTTLIRTRKALPTLPTSNNQGNSGGVMYFDLTVTNPLTITGVDMNYTAIPNAQVGVLVYTTSGTRVGAERNAAVWTLVGQDDGQGRAAGREQRTTLRLATPLAMAPGSYGVALVAVGSGHAYTNGTGANQNFANADLALTLGAAMNVPFDPNTATALNQPRVWNGGILYCTDCGGIAATRGLGCPDSRGSELRLSTSGCPELGASFGLRLETNAAVTAPVFLLMGLSNQNWLGIVLPLDLGLFGAPTCSAYVSHDVVLGPFANPGGGAGFQTSIPLDPTLRGATSFWQGYLLEFGLNPLNLGTSDYRTVILP